MPTLNGVLINGINYSWGNIKVILFGAPIIGITKIDYKRSQSKENNHGWGVEPTSRGYSRVTYSGSIELYQDEWRAICQAAPNQDPLSIAPFQIQVTMWNAPGNSGLVAPTVDTLYNVEFLDDEFIGSEGDSKLLVTVPIIFAGLTHDS